MSDTARPLPTNIDTTNTSFNIPETQTLTTIPKILEILPSSSNCTMVDTTHEEENEQSRKILQDRNYATAGLLVASESDVLSDNEPARKRMMVSKNVVEENIALNISTTPILSTEPSASLTSALTTSTIPPTDVNNLNNNHSKSDEESDDEDICEVCEMIEAKYTCPRCKIRTCSVKCVKGHKQRTKCDGRSIYSSFVPVSQMNDETLHSDISFLTKVSNACGATAKSQALLKQKNVHPRLAQVARQAMVASRDVSLILSPKGLHNHAINTSTFNTRQDILYWFMQFVFPQAKNTENNDGKVYKLGEMPKHAVFSTPVPLPETITWREALSQFLHRSPCPVPSPLGGSINKRKQRQQQQKILMNGMPPSTSDNTISDISNGTTKSSPSNAFVSVSASSVIGENGVFESLTTPMDLIPLFPNNTYYRSILSSYVAESGPEIPIASKYSLKPANTESGYPTETDPSLQTVNKAISVVETKNNIFMSPSSLGGANIKDMNDITDITNSIEVISDTHSSCSLRVFMKIYPCPANAPLFAEFPLDRTIQECLRGATIHDFPRIFIAHGSSSENRTPSEADMYTPHLASFNTTCLHPVKALYELPIFEIEDECLTDLSDVDEETAVEKLNEFLSLPGATMDPQLAKKALQDSVGESDDENIRHSVMVKKGRRTESSDSDDSSSSSDDTDSSDDNDNGTASND